MAITKEQALANARARLANKTQAPARDMTLGEDLQRAAGRAGKSISAGIGGIGDIGKLVTDPLLRSVGYGVSLAAPETGLDIMRMADAPAPSTAVRDAYNELTGGEYEPRNKLERYVDTATEFAVTGGGMGAAGRLIKGATPMTQAVQRFLDDGAIPGLTGAGGAGVGLEYGRDEFPDNPLAQAGMALLGGAGGAAIGSAGQSGVRAAMDSGFAKDQSGSVPMPGGVKSEKSIPSKKVYRFNNNQNTPINNGSTNYSMFADDAERVEGIYGKNAWYLDVGEGKSVHANSLVPKIKTFLKKNKPLLEELGYDTSKERIDALASDFNPSDIVDAAGFWDDHVLANFVVDDLLKPLGIDTIITDNGAIAINQANAKSLPNYWDIVESAPFGKSTSDILEDYFQQQKPLNKPLPTLTPRQSFLADESGMLGKNPRELSKAKTLVYRALVEERGYTPEEAADLVRKAGKGELPVTLPELADNITLMRAEKRLRQNAGAAGQVEQDFLLERSKKLPEAIQKELAPIGKVTSPDVAGREASNASKAIISRAKQIRADKAEPFYKAAYNQRMDAVTEKMALRNPIVAKAFETVRKDPIWGTELAKYPENSLGRFDIVKRHLDDQIEGAIRSGEGAKSRVLVQAKNELLDTLDEISPMYKEARRVFAKNSPKVERLQNSIVGILADLDQNNLPKAGQKLFDLTPEQMRYARRVFAKNPNEWNQLIATHIADVGNKVNHSPMKLLNALSSKTASGSVIKESRLNAALSPRQIKAKDALFDNLERMTRIRGGSDTAENLMTDAQLAGAMETTGERIARGITTLKTYKNAPENMIGAVNDWFTLGVRNKNYEELARIFTGEGSEQFADEILRTKPGSPTAYKVIAKRIAETSREGTQGGIRGERLAATRIQQDESGSVNPAAAIGAAGVALGIEEQRQKALEAVRDRLKNKAPQQPAPQQKLPPQSSLTPTQQEEGFRGNSYPDLSGNGNRIVGYGFNIDSGIAPKVWKQAGLPPQLLRDVRAGKAQITQAQGQALYQTAERIAVADAQAFYGDGFDGLSQPQKQALVDMSYQMGGPRLGQFRDLKRHLKEKNKIGIVKTIKNSKYFSQTPERARRTAQLLLQFDS
jgi:GH24 family phage-related lysozyme (muramidase)